VIIMDYEQVTEIPREMRLDPYCSPGGAQIGGTDPVSPDCSMSYCAEIDL
jgi:hypothetical protein